MSDSRLRELERRWKETGTVDDQAAYLRELRRTVAPDDQVEGQLSEAVKGEDLEEVHRLLATGAEVDEESASKWRPLDFAATRKNEALRLTELLLALGADPQGRQAGPVWRSPLGKAEDPRVVAALLRAGADPNGPIPGHYQMGTLLGRRILGVEDVALADHQRNTVLERIRLLLEAGADPNAPHLSEHLLHTLCNKPSSRTLWTEMVGLLVGAGADVNRPDGKKATPLHVAAERAHMGILKLLIEGGAELDRRDDQGRTALWLAARGGLLATVRLLLEAGANAVAADDAGVTPYAIARQGMHGLVGSLLKEHGGAPATPPPKPSAPKEKAIAAGDRVEHSKFGAGTVKTVRGDKLTIAFDDAGTKTLLARFVQPAD